MPDTSGDQASQFHAIAHLCRNLKSVALRAKAVEDLSRARLHQPVRSDSHVLYQQFQAGRFPAARLAMNIEDGKRAAQQRIVVGVLHAFQHDELAGAHQSGLFGRAQCQQIVPRPSS